MRINLWAGPGAGKSTVAEGISHHLKKKGYSVELVREWIKEWAYMKRVPKSFDQAYIFMNQLHSEDLLLQHGVETVVTDSPAMLSIVYAYRSAAPYWAELLRIAKLFDEQYPSINIFLSREGIDYKQNGRYEDFTQAVAMDKMMMQFLDNNGVGYVIIPSVELDRILAYVEGKVSVVPLIKECL